MPGSSQRRPWLRQPHPQYEDLRKDILDLRKEVEALKAKLELDEYFLNAKQDKTDSMSLDLTQRTHQRLDTDNSFFLISVEGAVSWAYPILGWHPTPTALTPPCF